MPRHNFSPARGRTLRLKINSKALEGNLLGDPSERFVWAYLPDAAEGERDLPLFVDLAGFTGSGPKHLAWGAFAESVPQRVDRLIEEGKMGPVALAFPDCFTRLGGNQYIDSLAMGAWERFLCEELPERLEAELPIAKGRDHRAVFGKSSGGYGAMVHAMRHADIWGAAACHSGDMAFELCYLGDFPALCTALAGEAGGIQGFVERLEATRKIGGRNFQTLMSLAMAATYDPDPAAFCGIRLPVDLETCSLDQERWAAWLVHDPLRMIERSEVQSALRSLKGLYLDCGRRDQYHLQFGARRLCKRLEALDIAHHYEEFDDNHSGVDYRMDNSLPFLYQALRGSLQGAA